MIARADRWDGDDFKTIAETIGGDHRQVGRAYHKAIAKLRAHLGVHDE